MALTTTQCYWMRSTVITITISLFYSVLTLQSLIVDVLLILMMLLCTAVSLIIAIVYHHTL